LVYIKRIDLRGFKTFGRKTTIHLGRGLTIVTGPNGSGKSNVLDSVKFALGELSPKELRGETIGDLVYKGAAQTIHTKAAYVAVQFDNHDRRIPIDAEAVTISREFRRGGEGIYRLNGKRISRKQLTDILSSADIQVSSFNIVPQHAITRLAEVTTEERRRIIEDMIGIAVYDTKRATSQAELQQADLNLQVASAKIEEVRLRVESLEREKNDYLKFKQVRNEINKLQAKEVSFKIRMTEAEIKRLESEISDCQRQLQELKATRDKLLHEKSEIDSKRRELEESVVEQSNNKLFTIQSQMGDVSARIASLRASANAIDANSKALQKQKTELALNSVEISQRIEKCKADLPEITYQMNNLTTIIEQKQSLVNQSNENLLRLRQSLGENNKEAQDVERQVNRITQRLIKVEAQIEASNAKIDLLEKHLKTLSARKEEYGSLIQSITERIDELKNVEHDALTSLSETDRKIIEYNKLKEQRACEIQQAEGVAERAGSALIELETQRKIADDFASEDRALALIEEMSKAGALVDVYGRLSSLIKFKKEHARAIESAAAGWMKAVVVKNIESAVACIEVLKKTRVGRVKILPTQSTRRHHAVKAPVGLQGIIGPIINHLVFEERYREAVSHVFGDTVLALNHKSAFLASLSGVRAVALTGDLYEAGGAMETGYFRQPIDFTSLLLRGQTVNELRTTLSSLEKLATKTREDISRLKKEIEEFKKNKSKTQTFLSSVRKEIENFESNLNRTKRAMDETSSRVESITRDITTEHTVMKASSHLQQKVRDQLTHSEKLREEMRFPFQSTTLMAKEEDYSKLTKELNELMRQRIELERRLQSATSTASVLDPSLSQITRQLTDIDTQLELLNQNMDRTRTELTDAEAQLKELDLSRGNLSQELGVVRTKRNEYDGHLKKLDSDVSKIIDQLDPLNSELAQLTASQKNLQMQNEYQMNELKELGYFELVDYGEDEIEEVTKTLTFLKKELAAIGGVNELAVSQYEEVKNNYKHLATRIYDLEKEKLSILKFMNELDKQKLDAFMRAFNQVSQSFNEIFSTVTGGTGRLFLEKPETPFEAGADIRLQFPGKTEMTIASASGGEKSVGTVCFILSLQSIHPMPFYMMDEIDAHLDVVNSQRLAELLKRKSQGSQFIVVSLKDVTITRADTVYGVFIQDGVSQVLSLPMQEVNVHGRTH
jgi:chromosome segregation protein